MKLFNLAHNLFTAAAVLSAFRSLSANSGSILVPPCCLESSASCCIQNLAIDS